MITYLSYFKSLRRRKRCILSIKYLCYKINYKTAFLVLIINFRETHNDSSKTRKISVAPLCITGWQAPAAGMKGFSEIRLQQQQMGFQAEIRDVFFFFWDLISMSKLMHTQDSLHSAPRAVRTSLLKLHHHPQQRFSAIKSISAKQGRTDEGTNE